VSKSIPETLRTFAVYRMGRFANDINSCLDRLTDEQSLQRGGDHENSIANLLLHLEGNLRQWVLHGIDNQPDIRTRDAEFDLTPTTPIAEIRASFAATLAECRAVITAVPDDRMLELIDPQPGSIWGKPTVLEAIVLVESHLALHTGQIILLTKQMARTDLDLSMPRKR
jgi:uncharacterized damage-inducible protein DinB